MNVKKIVNFLILRDAVNTRNMTSLGLIMVLVGVFVAAGGKITSVPLSATTDGPFGALQNGAPTSDTELPDIQGDVVNDSESANADAPPTRERVEQKAVAQPRIQAGIQGQDAAPAVVRAPNAQPVSPSSSTNRDHKERLSDLELRLKNLDARMKETNGSNGAASQ